MEMDDAGVDSNFVKPFITGVVNTFGIQASTPVKQLAPHLKVKDENIDIAGIIGLISEVFNGTIAICFPKAVFLGIYSNMFGEKRSEITKDIEDAAAELLNIVFGQAKIQLNDRDNYRIQKAIPSVVKGTNLSINSCKKVTSVVIPFETQFGHFYLEIALDKEAVKAAA